MVGQFGGLSALTRTLSRELRLRGATVMSLDEPDAVAQATAANHFAADVYLGFESRTEPTRGRAVLPGPDVRIGRRTLAGRADRRPT